MGDRVRLALGGAAVVAASAALVIAVAATNATAFANHAGVPVGAAGVHVPRAASSGTGVTSTTPEATSHGSSTNAIPMTETVPAPEPFVVSGPRVATEGPGTGSAGSSASVGGAPRADDAPSGWSRSQVQVWLTELKARLAAADQKSDQDQDRKSDQDQDLKSKTSTSISGVTQTSTTEKSQSRGTPDRVD